MVLCLLGGVVLMGVLGLVVVLASGSTPSRDANNPAMRSRTDALLGQRGVVTEPIDPRLGAGRVVIAGNDWAAQAEHALAANTDIVVDGADGLVLHVVAFKPPA
jgi:membrane protein implicated in regulation of membrane protease activity